MKKPAGLSARPAFVVKAKNAAAYFTASRTLSLAPP